MVNLASTFAISCDAQTVELPQGLPQVCRSLRHREPRLGPLRYVHRIFHTILHRVEARYYDRASRWLRAALVRVSTGGITKP